MNAKVAKLMVPVMVAPPVALLKRPLPHVLKNHVFKGGFMLLYVVSVAPFDMLDQLTNEYDCLCVFYLY